jgi:hypothetical protein
MQPPGADYGPLDPRSNTGLALDPAGDPRIRAVAGHDTSRRWRRSPSGTETGTARSSRPGRGFIPGFERYEPTAPEAWADLRDRVAELLDA